MPDITVEVTQSDITANVTSPNITANVTSADVAANVTTAEVTANVEAANVTVNITGGESPHIIQDEGTAETQRANLNFVGAGVSVSDDSANNATVVTISGGGGGGGGTWGSITGTLSDQTDLQAALDAKAASSHTHALSDITQSGATTNQVPKWNGSAWVPANEAGGADGNGIYSGSGTIPGATEALLEPNGSFDIHFDGGIGAFVISDGTGSTAIQNKAGTATIAADSTGVIIVADDMLSIEAEGSTGTLNQVLTRGANGAIWQDATGGGASVTQITYAATQTAITNGTLTPGGWYLITDAAGTDLGFLTNAVNENTINVQGVGGYLNADFQAVGDYSNTPETFGAQLGIWRTGFEVVTINYLNLAGGTFAVGDTITGDSTAATAVIVTDDGATSMTAYMTSAGVAFDGSEVLDNGSGVTADQDGATTSPTIVQGDVVIWNLSHYQLTDAALLDGNNPATNAAAYTLLDKATANVGYITAWDVSEFDFANAWLQYRQDERGNRQRYSFIFDSEEFQLGYSAILDFQYGNDAVFLNVIENSYVGIKNTPIIFKYNTLLNISQVENISSYQTSEISYNNLNLATILYLSLGENGLFSYNVLNINSTVNNVEIGNARLLNNTLYQDSRISDTIIFSGGIENNILENGASLTGITAGANCSISRNKVGPVATLGGGTTMGDGAQMNDNVLGPSASISDSALSDGAAIETNNLLGGAQIGNNTLNESALISGNNIGSDASIMGNTLMDSGYISGNILLGADAAISNNTVQADGQIANCTVTPGVDLANKTVQTGIYLSESYFSLSANETEDISDNIEGNRTQSGFSDIPGTIDITGLTTLDCTAAWAQYRGIFNLTSTNATEAIDTITNPPTAFPFTIRPAAGLVLTITGTAYAGIAAGQIALKAASYTLNPGEYIVLEYEAATGALIENRVVNALL